MKKYVIALSIIMISALPLIAIDVYTFEDMDGTTITLCKDSDGWMIFIPSGDSYSVHADRGATLEDLKSSYALDKPVGKQPRHVAQSSCDDYQPE